MKRLTYRGKKVNRVVAVFVLSGLLVFLFPTSALAGPGLPGHWHGYPDPDACNTYNDCIYIFDICFQGNDQTLGTWTPNPLQPQALVDWINDKYGSGNASLGHCPSIKPPLFERCKLLDIDSPIVIGTEFNARWSGSIQSLRFTGENSQVFISPNGSVQFSEGSKTGGFSTMGSTSTLLAPGKYQVNCFGSEGTVGESISVTVTR